MKRQALHGLILCTLTLCGVTDAADKHRSMSEPTPWACYQPLVIVGEGWSQQFVIQNVDNYHKFNFRGTLRFFDREGKPWPVDVVGRGRVTSVPLDIPVYGSATVTTVVYNFEQQLGWARVDVQERLDDRAYIHAHTIFRKQAPGRPDLMTSVPMSSIFADNAVVYFDNTAGNVTGLAILASSDRTTEQTFTLTLFGENGQPFHRATRRFQPGQMWWIDLAAQIPDAANRRGQVLVEGSYPHLFTLQFTANGSFTAISTTEEF